MNTRDVTKEGVLLNEYMRETTEKEGVPLY